MVRPELKWFAKMESQEQFSPSSKFYGGTYTGTTPLSVVVQLWNNRWGKEDVPNITNFYIEAFFTTLEDNALLQYCKIYKDGVEIPTTIERNRLVIKFPMEIALSGKLNNGLSKENKDNFLEFCFKFDVPTDTSLKQRDLKSLCFEIIKQ